MQEHLVRISSALRRRQRGAEFETLTDDVLRALASPAPHAADELLRSFAAFGERRARASTCSLDGLLADLQLVEHAVREVLRGKCSANEEDALACALRRGGSEATATFTGARVEAECEQREADLRARLERSERALAASAHQLRVVADSVPIHLLHVDASERLLFVNRATSETWQLPSEELVGKAIRDVVGDETHRRIHEHTVRVLRGEQVQYESAFAAPDGQLRTFLNTYSPDRDDDGLVRGFVATGTEITDRKKTEEELGNTVARLRHERELRDRYIAMLTHDLRTPLNTALMSAHLLAESGAASERAKTLAARIVANIERADHMLRDLLDANRLDAGQVVPLEMGRCDLTDLTKKTLDELGSFRADRFVLVAPAHLEGYWSCSGVRRILENLCGNALKYGTARTPITVSIEARDAWVTLSVHNVGRAIPEEEQATVFDAFQRSSTATAAGERGWGLGLTLVKGIVEAHGGTVSVSSSEAEGTRFTVSLPRDARTSDGSSC